MCKGVKDEKIDTLLIRGWDKNGLYYNLNKNHFPNIKTIYYKGGQGFTSTYGLYNFENVIVDEGTNLYHFPKDTKVISKKEFTKIFERC